MTRYRVPFSVAVIAAAVSAAVDANAQSVPKQSGRARMTNSTGVVAYCDNYTSVTTTFDGAVEIACSGTPTPTTTPTPTSSATEAGVLSFTTARVSDTPQNQVIPLVVQRTAVAPGGIPGMGSVDTLLDVSRGPCVISGTNVGRTTVLFNAGEIANKTYYLTATGMGECAIRLVTDAADGRATAVTSTFVNVIAASGTPAPTPTPTSTPAPTQPPTSNGSCTNSAGDVIPVPTNMVTQRMYIGGSNNYVFDSDKYTNTGQAGTQPGVTGPTNTIQAFELPKTWGAGTVPVTSAIIQFASYIFYSAAGVQYEVAFSKCKGDFSYYKTPTASVTIAGSSQSFQPCGIIWGSDSGLAWSIDQGSYNACRIPSGETWYMNWRVVQGTCPANLGYTCGQTFYVPGG